jgi:integrase
MAGITKRAVDNLAIGAALWDAGHREAVRGFGVRRQKATAVYVLKYRAMGRQRMFTIGPHGSPWTPDTARQKAKELLGLVAAGKDPADERKQAALQARDTLRQIIDAYLLAAKLQHRPSTYYEVKRYLLDAWRPLHAVSVHAITRRHVADRVTELTEASGATSATRARVWLSAMFNWAIGAGIELAANPVHGTNRPAEPGPRKRVLADAELAAIWRACGDDDYGRIIRLLILTAQRREEIAGLRWQEITASVDGATLLPSAMLRLPPERVKNKQEHLLPLSQQALAMLPPRGDADCVFQRHHWSRAKAALDARIAADGAALAPWVIHDIRRSVATRLADKLGVLPHIVESILNHVSGHKSGVSGIYNLARYEAEMRAALCAWADYIAALIGTPANG